MRATTDAVSACLIIGASKAGTTSLFDSLAGHPAVVTAAVKEVRYFSNDDHFARGADWYGGLFTSGDDAARVRLDASPAYMTWSEKSAPRIRAHFGTSHPRFVVILRDPVARAYSHYWHRVRLGHEPLTFIEALACENERLQEQWTALEHAGDGRYGYARASRYAERLRPFLDAFERDQFCFLLQDDLRPESWPATARRLLEFLALDPSVTLEARRSNSPTAARNPGVVRAWNRLKRTGAAGVYRALVPQTLRERMPSVLFRPDSYPPLDAATEQQLRERFVDDVLECQALLERDLSRWLPS